MAGSFCENRDDDRCIFVVTSPTQLPQLPEMNDRADGADRDDMGDATPPTQLPEMEDAGDVTPPTQLPEMDDPVYVAMAESRSRRPVEGSIYALLRKHAGTSLFVRPALWTDLHAQLLDAHFWNLQPCSSPVPASRTPLPPSREHARTAWAMTVLKKALKRMRNPVDPANILNSDAIETVLSTLWPSVFKTPQLSPKLRLVFGKHVYNHAIPAQIMWNNLSNSSRPSSQSSSIFAFHLSFSQRPSTFLGHDPAGLPMMCYIGKPQLAAMRKDIFLPCWKHITDRPVLRVLQAKVRKISPANSDHDVQFVAIFLAMAQQHFYVVPQQAMSDFFLLKRPFFHDVKLRILTHDETGEFIVYTACVTARFLERFHEPRNAPHGTGGEVPGMDISYMRVPTMPIKGLRKRLGKALGEEIVGALDDEQSAPCIGKRNRQALPEASYGTSGSHSLDSSDSSGDTEPHSFSPKRRCLD